MIIYEKHFSKLHMPHLFVFFLLFIPIIGCANDSYSDPQKKVHEVTQAVIARLSDAKEQLAKDPEYIKTIVAYLILPHVDFRKLAAATVSEHWYHLSEGERRCLTISIRERIVERYARVLLESEYHNIVTDPLTNPATTGPVFVTQTVSTPNPTPLKVKYKLERVDDDWKIVDLIVADVSLVASYRVSFTDEINKEGVGDFLRMLPACRER